MNIGEQLKATRKMRGMKGVELARKAGLPTSTISQIENGKLNPTAETIEKIADALDCTVRVLPNSF